MDLSGQWLAPTWGRTARPCGRRACTRIRPVESRSEEQLLGKQVRKMEKLYTLEEVADYTRMSTETIRWLRVDGRFAPAVKIGKRLRWRESAIEQWIEDNTEQAAS